MKKRKIKILEKMALLGLLINSFGMTYAFVMAEKIVINVNCVQQEKDNWCWAACAENSVRAKMSITKTQKDAVKKLKGSVLNPYPNVPGTYTDTANAAEYISDYKYSYIGVGQAYGFDILKSQLNHANVTIVGLGLYDSLGVRVSGHSISIVGYEITENNDKKIYYHEPLCGNKYWCRSEELKNNSLRWGKWDTTCHVKIES